MASVVIVNYNGKRFLKDCFSALADLDFPKDELEIILVDNASTDGSVPYVRQEFPWITVVESAENLGFAGGNNLGIANAHGNYVALLNNDTVVEKLWLREMVEVLDGNPKAGACTSKMLFIEASGADVINNAGSIILRDGSSADRGFREIDRGQYEKEEEVFSACGASVLLRREMLEDVGLLDSDFFMYYEDTDLAWRARLKGWKIIYNPRSLVRHVHCGSSVEWSPFFVFHVESNRLFMLAKNARLTLFVLSWLRYLVWPPWETLRVAWLRLTGGADRERVAMLKLRKSVGWNLLKKLPRMLGKRWSIGRSRTVSRREVENWMVARRAGGM